MPRHIYSTPFVICPPDDLVYKLPHLRRMSSLLAGKYADGQVVTEEDLRGMGSALWDALNLKDSFESAHSGAGAAILSVILESGAADVQSLPWETLFHPTLGFIGRHAGFTFSRRMKAAQEVSTALEKGPLRVLLFTSMPEDQNRLKVEEEQAQVQEALLPWISKGLVKLEMPDDGRFSTLQAWLKDFQPQVLFLSGHGKFHHAPHTGEAGHGVFLFESETGDGDAVEEDKIARALVGTGVQLVALSACESSKTASDALTHGLTQHISEQGIPHVIGMRESILDAAGIQFARVLCEELVRAERVDWALQAARIATQTPFKDIPRREAGNAALEELSLGQWCLPMLISPNPQRALINWDFPPQAVDTRNFKQPLNTVSLPPRFFGRRAEMRQYKSKLLNGEIHNLLITGAGGQGKTSLAGKLALDLRQNGWRVFAWSARPENPWDSFVFDEMELALDQPNAEKYSRFQSHPQTEAKRARFMLDLLMEQFNGRVVFFLDNLETVQDPATQKLTDATVQAWMHAARAIPDLILLATSRFLLPDWDGEHLSLTHANLGDFLQMAAQKKLPQALLEKNGGVRRVWEVFGGNCRGLDFFAAAVNVMQNAAEEDAFLNALAQTKSELQANMALEEIYKYLPADAQKLLQRLPAYQEPVPEEGILKLALDLQNDSLVERLLAVSLLEAQWNGDWQVWEYQPAPLVTDWLGGQGLIDSDPRWQSAAADYHLYLFNHERRTLSQAITTHHALRRAKRDVEADRLTLDSIVGSLTLAGFFAALLQKWLPRICESEDLKTRGDALGWTGRLLGDLGNYETALGYLKQSLQIMQQIGDKAGEGTTLNNISQIYDAQGDYETALGYLKQSLQIRQQIGDKAGLCATLFNMGHMHWQNKQQDQAMGAWVTVYTIAKSMNLAQALQALASLAPQLGIPEGLAGWEELSKKMKTEG